MSRRVSGLACAALLLCAPGCGPKDPSCSGAQQVTLSEVQASIFTPSCATAACHRGPRPAQDLDLSDGHAYASLASKRSTLDPSHNLVDPENPSGSVLYTQVESGQMPQSGGPLPSDLQQKLHDWICSGAPDAQPGEAGGSSSSSSGSH